MMCEDAGWWYRNSAPKGISMTSDAVIHVLHAEQQAVDRRSTDDRLADAIALIERLEWHKDGSEWSEAEGRSVQTYTCPSCHAYDEEGHEHDCELAAFLGRPTRAKWVDKDQPVETVTIIEQVPDDFPRLTFSELPRRD